MTAAELLAALEASEEVLREEYVVDVVCQAVTVTGIEVEVVPEVAQSTQHSLCNRRTHCT